MNRSLPRLLMVLGLVATTGAASGHGATVPDEVRVAIQDLSTEPPDYVRQKLSAQRLTRLKAGAAPAVPTLIKVIGQLASVSRFLSALSE